MDGWIAEASAWKIMTVALVLSAAVNRSKRTKLQWIINAAAIALVLSMRGSAEGYRALAVIVCGAALGTILSLPLHRLGWITRTDVSTSCALGAHLQPAGFGVAFGIAVAFIALQHLLKARTTATVDPLFSGAPFYPMMQPRGPTRPSLAEMESQRILREDDAEAIAFGSGDGGGGLRAACTPAVPNRDEVLPWPYDIALGTLAVMMLGFPW